MMDCPVFELPVRLMVGTSGESMIAGTQASIPAPVGFEERLARDLDRLLCLGFAGFGVGPDRLTGRGIDTD
jgi:hypothetical protein